MHKIIFSTICSLVTLLIIDGTWLLLSSKRFYAPNLGNLLAENIQIIPIVLFYTLYAFGISVFVILPALQEPTNILKTILLGGLFGCVAYGAYDFTNQATIKNWPMIVTIVDLAWGTVLTATTSVIVTKITKYFS